VTQYLCVSMSLRHYSNGVTIALRSLQEPDCLDQYHITEAVSWAVFEAGAYESSAGAMFQAGTVAVQGGGWETVPFHVPFPATSANVGIAVLTQIQTTNDPHFAKTRQRHQKHERTLSSFQLAVEQIGSVRDAKHRHGLETAGWVAFEPGRGTIGETQYEVGLIDKVTHVAKTIKFARPFLTKPEMFASMATTNGGDASQMRLDGKTPNPVTTTTARLLVEEEECVDKEGCRLTPTKKGCKVGKDHCVEYVAGNGCHAPETVAWLALGNAWKKATRRSICFGAGGDDFGDDRYAQFQLPEDAGAVKLVYRSGGVSCNFKGRGKYSYWGCDQKTTSTLSTFITTATNGGRSSIADIVAPSKAHIVSQNLWYTPFDDNWSQSSELTFTASAQQGPTNVYNGQQAGRYAKGNYLIWYGEDLGDRSQHDNGGKTCVDVYYLKAPPKRLGGQQQMNRAQTDLRNTVNQIITAVHAPKPLEQVGEIGNAVVDTNWVTVKLKHKQYRNPVVFCGVPSRYGTDPAVCRIKGMRYSPFIQQVLCTAKKCSTQRRGCGGWCFEIAVQEPKCKDQWHVKEDLSWMVLEEGSFMSDNGALLQVGSVQLAGHGWHNVNFRGNGFKLPPSKISQVQTTNGASCSNSKSNGKVRVCEKHTVGQIGSATASTSQSQAFSPLDSQSPFTHTRQTYCVKSIDNLQCDHRRTATSSFQLALETEGKSSTSTIKDHIIETAAWAAFARGHGTLGESTYEAGVTPKHVMDKPYQVDFAGHFRIGPHVFASISTYHGHDAAELRIMNNTLGKRHQTSFAVMVEEEACTQSKGCAHHTSGNVGNNGKHDAKCKQNAARHPKGEEVDYIAVSAGLADREKGAQSPLKASPLAATISSSSNHRPVGESGDITVTHKWVTIALQGYYQHPAVIAGVPSYKGGDPVAARIRHVRHGHGCAGWCFDIRLQEPDCKDDKHVRLCCPVDCLQSSLQSS
jgi:hypothetical protein